MCGKVRHAVAAVASGCDFVVAQGTEGGGHTGTVATMALVPQVVDAVGDKVAVVAAGGLFDGRGLAASLALGADGSLYVSDQTYNVATGIATGPVKKFDAAGNYVGEVIGSGASGLFGPTGLLISGSTLYTASIMTGAVLKTDLTTQVTSPFGSTGAPFGAGPLAMMTADRVLAGSPAGDGAIYQFYADGTSGPTFSSGLGQIGGIVAVPEPGSVTLAVTGAGLAAWCAWRRRRAGSKLRRS